MSKSQKWKLEWSFFLDADGRRKYADLCRHCVRSCKQSFRAVVIDCPHFFSKRSEQTENCKDKG